MIDWSGLRPVAAQPPSRGHYETPSGKVNYNTPTPILDGVRYIWPEGIALDPCSNSRSLVGADEAWTETERQWSGFKFQKRPEDTFEWRWKHRTYVNPPYGDGVGKLFFKKILCEAQLGMQMLVLVPARTSNHSWQDLMMFRPLVCFYRGRIAFIDADTGEVREGTPFPSVLIGVNLTREQQARFVHLLKDQQGHAVMKVVE